MRFVFRDNKGETVYETDDVENGVSSDVNLPGIETVKFMLDGGQTLCENWYTVAHVDNEGKETTFARKDLPYLVMHFRNELEPVAA